MVSSVCPYVCFHFPTIKNYKKEERGNKEEAISVLQPKDIWASLSDEPCAVSGIRIPPDGPHAPPGAGKG